MSSMSATRPTTDIGVTGLGVMDGNLALGRSLCVGNGAVTKRIAARLTGEIGAVSGLAGVIGSLAGALLPVVQGPGQEFIGSYVFGFVVLAALALIRLILQARPLPVQS
jgi:nitrate/nitrite transporter NarK